MIRQFKHQDITWIDVSVPTAEELNQLSRDYELHSLVENELSSPSPRSRLDSYEKYLYLILHFPATNALDQTLPAPHKVDTNEIDFIIGQKFLITIHYQPIQSLDEFSEIFETTLTPDYAAKKAHAGYLFFHILIKLYQSLDKNLEILNSELKKIEKNIFAGQEKAMVRVLADLHHELLDFRWALKSHTDILSQLEDDTTEFFGADFRFHPKLIRLAYNRVNTALGNLQEMYNDLRTTNDSLLTIKTNEIMKVLTIMAFITFPLSVLTSTFGMNTVSTPILGARHDFWIIVVIMLTAVTTMFGFFRYKRWI